MKAREIIESLERFAPTSLQEPYDNAGIQIGDTETDIKGILISLDVTEEILDEAIGKGCNMIVTHHPLLFRGLKQIAGKDYVQRTVAQAIKNDIVIYSAHTNLDKCADGVSWKMAELLGLENVSVLVPEGDGNVNAGLGCVGELPAEIAETEALLLVKKAFNAGCVRHTAITGRMVRRIAVCGGSGSEFIDDAIRAQADIYVTADVKYHEFFRAENKMIIADIGHFESERATKDVFYAQISKLFPKFAVRISECEHNVISYM